MSELRRLFSDLRRIHALLARAVDLQLRSVLGVPLALFESMAVIADTEDCRVHDLADRLGVTSGGASKLADRLWAVGYCQRLPNPGDRRSNLLELTPAGRQLLAHARVVVDEELNRMLGQVLSETEVTEFASTLHAFHPPGARARHRPADAAADHSGLPPDSPDASI